MNPQACSSSTSYSIGICSFLTQPSRSRQRNVIRAKACHDENLILCHDQVRKLSCGLALIAPLVLIPFSPCIYLVEPSDKSVEIMRKFSEQYARKSGTYFCVDKGVTAVVIKGLADHKDSLGAPLCPCRHYDDKAAEVGQGFWNCPCVPMRERKECHCMLFLTPENDFSGKDQTISLDEIRESTANM